MSHMDLFSDEFRKPGTGEHETSEVKIEEGSANSDAPLAARMRPRTLDEFRGQEHLLGAGKTIQAMLQDGKVASMILWGPPGTGKSYLIKRVLEILNDAVVCARTHVATSQFDTGITLSRFKHTFQKGFFKR